MNLITQDTHKDLKDSRPNCADMIQILPPRASKKFRPNKANLVTEARDKKTLYAPSNWTNTLEESCEVKQNKAD